MGVRLFNYFLDIPRGDKIENIRTKRANGINFACSKLI